MKERGPLIKLHLFVMHKIRFQLITEIGLCGSHMENAATALATGREYAPCGVVIVSLVMLCSIQDFVYAR